MLVAKEVKVSLTDGEFTALVISSIMLGVKTFATSSY